MIIAILVSDRMETLHAFMYDCKLKPSLFILVSDSRPEKLAGLSKDIPVIIILRRDASLSREMEHMISPFKSVRCIEY